MKKVKVDLQRLKLKKGESIADLIDPKLDAQRTTSIDIVCCPEMAIRIAIISDGSGKSRCLSLCSQHYVDFMIMASHAITSSLLRSAELNSI